MMIRLLLAGLCLCAQFTQIIAAEIVARGSTWKYLKGITGPAVPAADEWRLPAYSDASWLTGPAPFYYGEALTGTLLSDMQGGYTSVFMRKTFSVSNPAAIDELQLETLSDDGFIAWINGREVLRYNMPGGDILFTGTSLGALAEPIPWETITITNARSMLVQGVNVLAVLGFNASIAGSSDFVFDSALTSVTDVVPPTIVNLIPPAGALARSLRAIEVIFSESVIGVDAGDLLINGAPAARVSSFGAAQWVFEFPEPTAGTVQVSWAVNHGIRDASPAGNAFFPGGWSYQLDPNAPVPEIMISEFMAENDETLNDEDGDQSDWIEIFNPTAEPVDLAGWFLTDDSGDLTQWRFPAVSVDANAYLVVFASEKNRTNPAARLHTNFKLRNEGGFLALVDERTNLVSSFAPAYPRQRGDVSYGRERSNPGIAGFFDRPTPGAPNTSGGPGFAPEVKFTRRGGTFTEPFQLALSTRSTNAVIRYTIGKNLPTEASPAYTGPIAITNTMQVRARVFEPGLIPGPPRSESFVMLSGPVVNATSDLPMVILHNYAGGSVPATGEQFVMMQIFEPKNGVASLTNAPDLSERARFRRRGSSTQDYSKWSFALEAWDEFGDDKDIRILDFPAESDWVFYAPNNFEPALIHNPFMHQLSKDIGRYSPRTRFAEVYLNTGGGAVQQVNYFGIYVIEEKIKRGQDRVDIDALEPEHLKAPEVTGGYLLKIDRSDPGDFPFSAAGQDLNFVYPKGPLIRTAARDPQEQYIINYFRDFGTALNGSNYRDPVNGYAKFIDVPAWIDHHLLNVLAFNVDALRLSTYLHKPRGGKITFGPIWDFDRALGSTDGRDSNPRVWWSDGGTDFFTYPWWGRLFQDPNFWQQWVDRWEELRRNEFSNTNFNRLVDQLSGQVKAAQPRELAKWRISPRGGSYPGEITHMKNYLRDRAGFIDGQLVRPPALSRPAGPAPAGTLISLTGSTNTLYYTLDGTDPRASGGAIAAGARLYTAPINLQTNVRVFARAYRQGHTGGPTASARTPWSGFVAATYVTEKPALAVSEIMYHPGRAAAGVSTNEDFEFIELLNFGSKPIELAGFTLTNGIDFRFGPGALAPGARTVVAKNRAVFESRYGTSRPIAGIYSGSLANSGDRITLLGPLQEPIADFRYDPEWLPVTDGPGFSMTSASEIFGALDQSKPTAWRASAKDGGSPGLPDEPPVPVPAVWINEVLSRPIAPQLDAVELRNPGTAPADISSWWLTDEFDQPAKFRIPGGTVIPGGGHVVFGESALRSGPDGFSFGAGGDAVFLFSANLNGELTGYQHGFRFGPAAAGASFGRHVSSDLKEHFPAQAAVTLNAPNSLPSFGPLILSEIFYQPQPFGTNDNTLDEFVEVQNVSAQAISFGHAVASGAAWRLRGGADFDFPDHFELPPGALAVLVNFDPETDAAIAAAFRARWSVPAGALLLGPLRGNLDNGGERIILERPELSESSRVEFIAVDEVGYSPALPWPPDAAGSGKSLQRVGASFANDPVSWTSGAPTPGTRSTGNASDADGDGLPSDWEIANGLRPDDSSGDQGAAGDPDQDGLTNLEEYQSGTHPKNPASALKIESAVLENGQIALRFSAAAGKSYSILRRDNLQSGSWVKLADLSASALGGPKSVVDSAPGAGQRYYLLVTPAR